MEQASLTLALPRGWQAWEGHAGVTRSPSEQQAAAVLSFFWLVLSLCPPVLSLLQPALSFHYFHVLKITQIYFLTSIMPFYNTFLKIFMPLAKFRTTKNDIFEISKWAAIKNEMHKRAFSDRFTKLPSPVFQDYRQKKVEKHKEISRLIEWLQQDLVWLKAVGPVRVTCEARPQHLLGMGEPRRHSGRPPTHTLISRPQEHPICTPDDLSHDNHLENHSSVHWKAYHFTNKDWVKMHLSSFTPKYNRID